MFSYYVPTQKATRAEQMDVVALNEQLRSEFSPIVRQLQLQQMTISSAAAAKQQELAMMAAAPVSSANASATVPAPSPSGAEQQQQQAVRIDHYKHHCHTILNRLNTYQYGTMDAFKLDIEQLLKVARSHEQQQELQVRWFEHSVMDVCDREADWRLASNVRVYDYSAYRKN
jgi:hypothetical protein